MKTFIQTALMVWLSVLIGPAFAQSSSTANAQQSAVSTSTNNGTNASTNISGSSATSNPVSTSTSYSTGNVGNSSTNNPSSNSTNSNTANAGSTASNSGNTQLIQFITPQPTTEQTAAQARAAQALQATPTSATIDENVNYSGTQTIKNVPSVNGPPLTTSNDTCMGSMSGSVNGPGFGFGLGSTWTDRNCVMLKNAREMWNMGMKAAAMALMCTDGNNRMALEITGFVCPQTAAARQAEAEAGKQASLLRENEQLKARLSAIESAKAEPAKERTSWNEPQSNPSAEAMLPAPVPPVAAAPAPLQIQQEASLPAAPAPAPAPGVEARQETTALVQEPKVEATPVRESSVQAMPEAEQATLVRVVSDPKQ